MTFKVGDKVRCVSVAGPVAGDLQVGDVLRVDGVSAGGKLLHFNPCDGNRTGGSYFARRFEPAPP